MEMDLIKEVTRCVGDVLQTPSENIDPDASLLEELGMDSVLAIDVAGALERRFKIRVPEEFLGEFGSVREIVAIVERLMLKAAQ